MEESDLRRLVAEYLNQKFKGSSLVLPFFDFHATGMTLTSYLRKKYFGKELARLPYVEEVEIRPDILGIIALAKTDLWIYVLAEVKTQRVKMSDFRQCMNYMNAAHPLEGYLAFSEQMTEEVKRNILADNHKFLGLNSWGSLVSKRVHLLHFRNERFLNGRLDL
jgi:hypothetical protein